MSLISPSPNRHSGRDTEPCACLRENFTRSYVLCPCSLMLGPLFLMLLLSAISLSSHAQGWVKQMPPGIVQLTSGKRNPVFMVGEPISFKVTGKGAIRFEVRGYDGEITDRGSIPDTGDFNLKREPPGWYKLYVYGGAPHPPYGYEIGGTTFVVFRKKPGFPDLPPVGTPSGSNPSMDEPMRGVIGMGPQRHAVHDASKPEEAIRNLEADIALDKQYYLPFDPYRKRELMVAFPNGTKDLAGVRKIVERFKHDVKYWEPRNEPGGNSSGADFAIKEMKPFYETVKSVDPSLKVMGPGTVSIGPLRPGLTWVEDFLKAGGGAYIDAFSFHAYNTVNGDLWMARTALKNLNTLLAKYGVDKLEKWQTEQGYFAAMYGAYLPCHQGRWTMLQMMVYEQFGIPKEHNHLWYDKSHGFWDFPTWWENEDGSLNPAAPLMRVWAEELYGTRFARAFDLGPNGNKLTIGSLFEGPVRRVAAFQSAGSTDSTLRLSVTGGSSLHLVSAFGVESTLPVVNGACNLPVTMLPVYVELSSEQQMTPEVIDWGKNLATAPGVSAKASGTGQHPADPRIKNDISKIINGDLENWYYTQKSDSQPWMDDTPGFPAWVEIDLPQPQRISRVVVYAAPPWQLMGTLLDYELQVDRGGSWVTLEHVTEPTRTIQVLTPVTKTTVDSFATDRWIFQDHFAPVTTRRIRLLVHNATYGGGEVEAVAKAGGQTGPHHIMLREVEIYAR